MSKPPHKIQVPPLGPGWAGALMGVSISTSLVHIHLTPHIGRVPEIALLMIATMLALSLAAGWAWYRNPGFYVSDMPAWGMVSMGMMALGSAWSSVLSAWAVHAALWAVGGALGVVTCVRFAWFLIRGLELPAPAFTWGLPLVAPMVTATASAQLALHLGDSGGASTTLAEWIHAWGVANFALTWLTAVPTFLVVYARTFPHVPASFAATAWIPLGMMGQSTAAAQLLAAVDGKNWQHAAVVYGCLMLALGVPLTAYALFTHWKAAFAGSMSYNPTWWGSTFPVGTLCFGSHTLALHGPEGLGWMDAVSAGLLALLLAHLAWTSLGTRHLVPSLP